MAPDIELRAATATPLISIRPRPALPELMGTAFGELFAYAAQNRVQPVGPPLAIYHEIAGEETDVEIGVPLARALEPSGRILAGELPAGEEAYSLHVGPYDGIVETYEALDEWIKRHGLVPCGPPREHYLNGPDEVGGPEEYRTEIVWPVRPA